MACPKVSGSARCRNRYAGRALESVASTALTRFELFCGAVAGLVASRINDSSTLLRPLSTPVRSGAPLAAS